MNLRTICTHHLLWEIKSHLASGAKRPTDHEMTKPENVDWVQRPPKLKEDESQALNRKSQRGFSGQSQLHQIRSHNDDVECTATG